MAINAYLPLVQLLIITFFSFIVLTHKYRFYMLTTTTKKIPIKKIINAENAGGIVGAGIAKFTDEKRRWKSLLNLQTKCFILREVEEKTGSKGT